MAKKHFVDLYTTEGKSICKTPWQAYPRPQLKRDSFINLNGEWDFCKSLSSDIPEKFSDKIIVPFPPQSLLSGVHSDVPEEEYLFYRRKFSFSKKDEKHRVILHIGAADQIADVWLNGEYLGSHTGGYLPFSFDVTSVIKENNILIIRIIDRMSSFVLPYGKQSAKRGGMWYTPVSGLWQTVWLENVPEHYIKSLNITTGKNFAEIILNGDVCDGKIIVTTPEGEITTEFIDKRVYLHFDSPRVWSPEDPYLYRSIIYAGEDTVETYFAIRTLSIEKTNGIPRLCLNGRPYFFHGLLDQGYWSDGIFTPASPKCYEYDIKAVKSLGFNTLRKHIKIEPEQFYYDCDRLGIVVFQDMINNGNYNFIRDTALPTIGLKFLSDKYLHRDAETRNAFLVSMKETVEHLKNHPCICYWTIFNEGWGQFESTKAYRMMKEFDDSRFIGSHSGWFKGGESDVFSEHCYFKRFKIKKTQKPLVLTEFGGYTFAPEGHIFNPKNEYGYKKFPSRKELSDGVINLYERDIIPSIKKGLCAAIYTQVSDVEDETNGIMSYDRMVLKITPEEFIPVSNKIYEEIKNAGL